MIGILAGVAVGVTLLLVNNADAADNTKADNVYSFPKEFKFGAASASYQIEGGWNEDGKSPNIWDTVMHNDPDYTADSKNGDVAADSYHMVDKDVEALENIGVSLNILLIP